jgi:acetolactate synthase I/II/III large subunit
MADMLKGYGVMDIFMVPAVLPGRMAEIEKRTTIRRIHAHGENAAAYMADGYARASGRAGVCMAQAIGALNLAAGLRDAFLARSPVIALTGGRDPRTTFRHVYQEVDDFSAFEPVIKCNATVDDVARFPDMIRQAFRVATTSAPGPVHLQFRGNQGQIDEKRAEMVPYCEPAFGSVSPHRPRPGADTVMAALHAIEAAERPVLVAGNGVHASGAQGDVGALAEALAIPVVTSLSGKDTISGRHPLSAGVVGTYSRARANLTVGAADLVCFIGTRAGGMTTHLWTLPAIGTPVIHVDIDPEAIGRNFPVQAAVLGDAKRALEQMLAAADRSSATKRTPWLRHVHSLCRDWYEQYEPMLASDAVPIRPEPVCHDLSMHVPDNAIIVVDTGHAGMWMGGMFDVPSGQQSCIRGAGHLGWAFFAGLGAKCGAPDRHVLTLTGDAGLWYHVAEIETAVRWKISNVTIVNNNSDGNQSKRGFDRAYGGAQTPKARELWTYRAVNFARIAEEIGAVGIRVERPADFASAVEKAVELRQPVVIDVVTDIEALAPFAVG